MSGPSLARRHAASFPRGNVSDVEVDLAGFRCTMSWESISPASRCRSRLPATPRARPRAISVRRGEGDQSQYGESSS